MLTLTLLFFHFCDRYIEKCCPVECVHQFLMSSQHSNKSIGNMADVARIRNESTNVADVGKMIDHTLLKGRFPVIAETTLNYTFSKEISQVILASMVLVPNFYCKNCQRVIPAFRGKALQGLKHSL